MNRSIPSIVAVASAVAALSPGLLAQFPFYAWPAGPIGNQLGSVASVGDFDGDHVADFAYTQPKDPGAGAGRLIVRSGASASVLLDLPGIAGDGYGQAVAGLGDLDGDGRAEVAVAASSYVQCVRGGVGTVLWQVAQAGVVSLAALPDLDGDGVADWAAGVPGTQPGAIGSVQLRSGANGGLITPLSPPPGASQSFGTVVLLAGDFDFDGRSDLAVGDPSGGTGFGAVSVHGLAPQTLLAHFQAAPSPFSTATTWFGAAVAAPGDFDGDGVPELLVGSPNEDLVTPGMNGGINGRVRLLSGASGAVLRAFRPYQSERGFGTLVAAYPDVDGDGRSELLMGGGVIVAGCCVHLPGEFRMHGSASSQLLIYRQEWIATRLAVIRDFEGDGHADLLVAQDPEFSLSTRMDLMFDDPVLPAPGCVPKVNSLGCIAWTTFSGTSSLTQGDDLQLGGFGFLSGTIGVFLIGPQSANVPFGGGMLCVGGTLHRSPVLATGGTGVCAGTMTFDVPKPMLASLSGGPGSTLFFQAWYRDSGFPPPNDVGLARAFGMSIWP